MKNKFTNDKKLLKSYQKFLLLGSFKDFHLNFPHAQCSKICSSWLIEDCKDGDSCKFI